LCTKIIGTNILKKLVNKNYFKKMSIISNNLKYLRKKKGLTQQQFADAIGCKRASVGAYEEERAEPKYDLLNKIAEFYNLTIDELVNEEISDTWKPKTKAGASQVRVLSVTLDASEKENIELVPVKASAGYLNGYADPEFVAELPKFSLPMFKNGTFRAFEIKGDSMLPLESGSIVIAEYVDDWNSIKPGQTYVIISSQDGVVYKRIGQKFKPEKGLLLVSDNKVYEPYWVQTVDVVEIWKAKGYFTTQLPEPSPEPSIESLTDMVAQMQKTLKSAIKNS